MSDRPRPPTPAEMETLFARLTDRGLTVDQIARLTDRQIESIYAHPRDERTGAVEDVVEAQAEELSPMEQDRVALFVAGRALGIPLDELIRQWQKKYGNVPWEV